MIIPPDYHINPKILKLIAQIDSQKYFIESLKIPLPLKEKIQRVSLLKSSLFSARIEGNRLTMENMSEAPDEKQKNEVFNILRGARYIERNVVAGQKITEEIVLLIHKFVMDKITTAGCFRREMGAIFNQDGTAVYISPPPEKINPFITRLLTYVNSDMEQFPLIKALITHLVFEKIHPFIDGNGRVGRLLIYAVLKSQGYDLGLFIPFEEYLEDNKSDYYFYLDVGIKRTNDYLQFMLEAYLYQLEKIKEAMLVELGGNGSVLLPPRQEEIYNTIKDHRLVSFDFIRRRFLKVPERTLRYDLKRLAETNFIIKIGKTRGSYYRIKL